MVKYDVVIVGSGPGGYVAAQELGKLGKKTAIIERNSIGGTCLNAGCIPSKSYLQHAKWMLAIEDAEQFGVDAKVDAIDFPQLVDRKDKVVKRLQAGIQAGFKAVDVEFIEGEASINKSGKVVVNGEVIEATDILLATGARPGKPDIKGLDKVDYLTNEDIFQVKELPKELTIIGSDFKAISVGFALQPLGVNVTILTDADDILPEEDKDVRSKVKRILKKRKFKIETKAKFKEVKQKTVETEKDSYAYDALFVQTERQLNLELADQLQLKRDKNNRYLQVDKHYQTSKKHVYATGDIIGGFEIAGAATAEAKKAARAIAGVPEEPVNKNLVVRSVFTYPEASTFGMSAEEATEAGYDVVENKMPFTANGRALANNSTDGFVKIISEKHYGQILGGVIVGENAPDLIHILVGVAASEGTVNELKEIAYAHPTLSELIGDTVSGIVDQLD